METMPKLKQSSLNETRRICVGFNLMNLVFDHATRPQHLAPRRLNFLRFGRFLSLRNFNVELESSAAVIHFRFVTCGLVTRVTARLTILILLEIPFGFLELPSHAPMPTPF